MPYRRHHITFLANEGSVPFFNKIAAQHEMQTATYDFITYNYTDPSDLSK